MDRNLTQRTRDSYLGNREEVRFNKLNPPKSEEEAQRKIIQLNDDICHIEADLEHKEVESYPSEADYEIWRKRAISALGYKKSEQKYLDSWLKGVDAERLIQNKSRSLESLRVRIRGFADKIEQTLPGMTGQPSSLEVALKRQNDLKMLHQEIETEFVQVKASAKTSGLTEKELTEVRKPLKVALNEVESRQRSLQGYISRHGNQTLSVESTNELSTAAQAIAVLALGLAEDIDRRYPPLYSVTAVPSGIPDAETRLEFLSAAKRELLAATDRVNIAWRDHPYSGGALKDVKRPLTVLSDRLDGEHQYLEAFCRKQITLIKAEQEQEERRAQETLHETALRLRNRAKGLAEELGGGFQRLYTADRPPTPEEARQRRTQLVELKRKLESASAEIKDAWTQHPLRREDLPSINRPIRNIIEQVDAELGVLKALLPAHQQQSMHRWKSVVVSALTRAVIGGFKLTAEEQEVLEGLVKNLGNYSD
jgi:hypothetical protein